MPPESRTAITSTLRELPHFRLLKRDMLDAVAAACNLRVYETPQPVFFEKDPCRSFWVVRAGGVKLFRLRPDGREQVINHLHSGQSFAEAALLNIGVYPVNAMTTEPPTELIEISGEHLRRLMRENDGMAAAMVGSLSMKLLDLVQRIDELSASNAATRLARHFLRLPGAGPSDRPTIELSVTKKDLAASLSITPETLSRILRKWQDDGLIESNGRSITILDAAQLMQLSDGEDGTPV